MKVALQNSMFLMAQSSEVADGVTCACRQICDHLSVFQTFGSLLVSD